jgi:hypothetical protein
MESVTSGEGGAPTGRRRLNLKPRDPQAAAKLDLERKQSASKNPFGAAKPREAVLAEKSGKKEEDILKEEVTKDKLHLRLERAEREQKEAAEAAVKDVEDELSAEQDPDKQTALKAELSDRQSKLDELMQGFEKMAIERAKSGGAPRVSERRAQLAQQGGPGYATTEGFDNFGRSGSRDMSQQGRGGYGRGSFDRGFDGYGGSDRPAGGYGDSAYQDPQGQASRGGYVPTPGQRDNGYSQGRGRGPPRNIPDSTGFGAGYERGGRGFQNYQDGSESGGAAPAYGSPSYGGQQDRF